MAPATSKPFEGEYPHIVLFLNSVHCELLCSICRGNASRHGAHHFFNERSFQVHFGRIHKAHKGEWPIFYRALTPQDVEKIAKGEGASVIERRIVTDTDGQPASKSTKTMPLGDGYPHVILVNGTYLQLKCVDCDGNCHPVKGLSQHKKVFLDRDLEFYSGIQAMKSHVVQAHPQGGYKGISDEKLVELCGHPLTGAELERVKADRTGGAIVKKLSVGEGKKPKEKAKTKAKNEAKNKASVGSGGTEGSAAEGKSKSGEDSDGDDEVEKCMMCNTTFNLSRISADDIFCKRCSPFEDDDDEETEAGIDDEDGQDEDGDGVEDEYPGVSPLLRAIVQDHAARYGDL